MATARMVKHRPAEPIFHSRFCHDALQAAAFAERADFDRNAMPPFLAGVNAYHVEPPCRLPSIRVDQREDCLSTGSE